MARSIYCSKCGKKKDFSYRTSGYCRKCRSEREKVTRLKKRLEKGLAPLGDAKLGHCVIKECFDKVFATKLCQKHYTRIRTHGSPFIVMKTITNLTKETFFNNYDIDSKGCWIWSYYTDKDGYGVYSAYKNNKKMNHRAHRLSYELFNGEIPVGAFVCHKCDRPSCVNPLHLYIGNAKENVRDREYKNRGAKGSKIGLAKLTENKVKKIKLALAKGVKQTDLAAKYNVIPATINKIKLCKTWKHVGGVS